jgi:hypothetical protein
LAASLWAVGGDAQRRKTRRLRIPNLDLFVFGFGVSSTVDTNMTYYTITYIVLLSLALSAIAALAGSAARTSQRTGHLVCSGSGSGSGSGQELLHTQPLHIDHDSTKVPTNALE